MKLHFLLPLFAVQNIVAAVLKVRGPEVLTLTPHWLARVISWQLHGPVELCAIWTPRRGLQPHDTHLQRVRARLSVRQAVRELVPTFRGIPSTCLVVSRIEGASLKYYLVPLAEAARLMAQEQATVPFGELRYLLPAA